MGKSAIRAFEDFRMSDRINGGPSILILSDKLRGEIPKRWLDEEECEILPMPIKFKYVQRALRKLLKIQVADG